MTLEAEFNRCDSDAVKICLKHEDWTPLFDTDEGRFLNSLPAHNADLIFIYPADQDNSCFVVRFIGH
jgi:hypothetical protein